MKFNKAHAFFLTLVVFSGFVAAIIDSYTGFVQSSSFVAYAIHDLFQKLVGAGMVLLLLYANRLEAVAKAKKAAEQSWISDVVDKETGVKIN